jgi:hypothetical protein
MERERERESERERERVEADSMLDMGCEVVPLRP